MPKELDAWFGEAMKRDAPVAKRTAWPDSPEFVRRLLDTWSDVSGLKFSSDRKYQVKCACSWYKEFGSDPQLVRDAFRKHQATGYNYKSLDSIRSMARTITGNKVEPDSREERDKYLKWVE